MYSPSLSIVKSPCERNNLQLNVKQNTNQQNQKNRIIETTTIITIKTARRFLFASARGLTFSSDNFYTDIGWISNFKNRLVFCLMC